MTLALPPRRIFLDTNVVNFILDHGNSIFEGAEPEPTLSPQERRNVIALSNFFFVGQRVLWELAISHKTQQEIMACSDPDRGQRLLSWLNELWIYWEDMSPEEEGLSAGLADAKARDEEIASLLGCFPDGDDRVLIAHAVAFNCDVFCTRDQRTILNRLKHAPVLPLEILSPADLWDRVAPWANLVI